MTEKEKKSDLSRGLVREVSVDELGQFCSGEAVVANDITGANGSILLPRGTPLANVASSLGTLQRQLGNANLRTVPLLLPSVADREELEACFRNLEPGLMPIEPELAHQTVGQVEELLTHITDGVHTPEDIQRIAERGKDLAERIAKAPQLMFCLGQVRQWDEYTGVHSINVALLSGFLATRMFPDKPEFAEFVTTGGILHDLGKAKVPLEILNKPSRLTDDEFAVMKRHPMLGVELAAESGITDEIAIEVIRGHHERYDGGGYPDDLSRDAISMAARISAVADVFDALTAKRVYKEPMPGRQAIELMTGAMGPHFDPGVMRVLILSVGLYPSGTMVELSDGSVGVIVGTSGNNVVYPEVLLWCDSFGQQIPEKKLVKTGAATGLFVKRPLQEIDKLGF